MLYIVNGKEVEKEEFDMKLDDAIEEEAIENYDDFLDEEGTIKVGGLDYYASHLLHSTDPIAYNCGMGDFEDMLREEKLGDLQNGETVEVATNYFKIEK